MLFSALIATASLFAVSSSRFITEPDPSATYEYIIVGSGAGGGPLAARLAMYGRRVLLIDAGGDFGDAYQYQVPALNLKATEYPDFSWAYYVNHYSDIKRQRQDTKMTYKLPSGGQYIGDSPPSGATPQGILYPRAAGLGGCTTHNALIMVYPNDSDWDDIASITGDEGWAASKMRSLFIRLERNRYIPNSLIGHGYNGWLSTSVASLGLAIKDKQAIRIIAAAASAFGQSFIKPIESIATLGALFIQDLNSGFPWRDNRQGLYQVPSSTNNGFRDGPRELILGVAEAKLANGERRYKLDILLNTLVTRVRFVDGSGKPKALGVDFLQGQNLYAAAAKYTGSANGKIGAANATKEVILSAGAFNTPQLLKLSGVGPRAELDKLGIPVVAHLPGVGTNLQDRYETTLISTVPSNFALTEKCTFLDKQPDPCLEDWKKSGTVEQRGVYTAGGLAIGAIRKSSVAEGDPDLFIAGAPANFKGYYPGYSFNATADSRHWSWVVLKAHTRNTAGTVTLRSTDARDVPDINFNSFDTGTTSGGADTQDLQAILEGMQFARRIVKETSGGLNEIWPGDLAQTTEQLKQFIKDEAWGHHACCTARIGADGDAMAVLDSKFRVRGVQGLRVVDTSVYPKIPGYFISLPTFMVSEKAADDIHFG